MKLEQNVGKPSRVIHIRNIPNETTEAEIIQLGLPFGRVTNVLVLKGKNQVSIFYSTVYKTCTIDKYTRNTKSSFSATIHKNKIKDCVKTRPTIEFFFSVNVGT